MQFLLKTVCPGKGFEVILGRKKFIENDTAR